MQNQYVRRVDQLDAISLDSELFTLFKSHYRKAFMYYSGSIISKIDPELDMLFRFLFRYLPLKYLGSTFGQSIFELKYCNSKTLSPASINKLRFLAAVSIGMPWFWDRVIKRTIVNFFRNDRIYLDSDISIQGQKFITFWKVLSLLNFCVFLQQSKFSSITERILQIRPLYTTSQEIKILQYDGISKELLWHGLDELLGFALPLINVYRLKNYFKCLWSWNHNRFSKFREKRDDCLICESIPNFPHTIGCEHQFCYYCIASMLLVDPNFVCIDCNFAASGLDCIKPLPLNKPTKNINT